jgi:addiction module RelE/StbE family toxin
MKIQWSSTAVSDLEAIREYIANDSPAAARRVAKRIKEAVNRLSNFPLSGRSGRVPGTRELVIPGTSYIAAYTIEGSEVLIAAVLHGRQNWPESFEERPDTTP